MKDQLLSAIHDLLPAWVHDVWLVLQALWYTREQLFILALYAGGALFALWIMVHQRLPKGKEVSRRGKQASGGLFRGLLKTFWWTWWLSRRTGEKSIKATRRGLVLPTLLLGGIGVVLEAISWPFALAALAVSLFFNRSKNVYQRKHKGVKPWGGDET